MPPKKGKGKGKGGKGKEKKVKTEPEPKLEHVDENTKQFFLLQIRDLEEKIKRYQRKCDELEIMCKKYETLYETSNTDKRDIVSNLKKELEKKMDEILDLNDRLVGLQQAKDAEKEAFDKQLTDLRTEFQETKDMLTNQNNSLLAKLTALEEFKSQKEELLSKLGMLEKQVEFLENDHKSKINDIEKKVIIDKDRLKKDMIVKVSQVAAEFRRVSNKQMADTTKRTIKENVSINSQLQKMSKKVTELIEDNSKEKEKMQVHKQQINLLEENEKELAKKNVSNLKVLRMLTDKCHSQEAMIVELEEKFNELSELNAFKDEDLRAMKSELEQLSQAKTDSEAFTERIKVLEKELDENRRTRIKIENILRKAIDAIVISLSKRAVAKSMAESSETSELEELEKRDSMLESLLILLNSGASLGFGPNPSAFGSSEYSNHRPFTSEFPGKKVSKELEDILLPRQQTNTFHYQLGDLGLIPKKNEHILTNIEKMKLHHPQKELGTLRKLTKKSVATQTIDYQKASIFGVESPDERSTGIHPIFDANSQQSTTKRAAVKSNVLNANNRVTDKVF